MSPAARMAIWGRLMGCWGIHWLIHLLGEKWRNYGQMRSGEPALPQARVAELPAKTNWMENKKARCGLGWGSLFEEALCRDFDLILLIGPSWSWPASALSQQRPMAFYTYYPASDRAMKDMRGSSQPHWCTLYQQTRDREGGPSEMWEEAMWLGGETCLLFGSTMKLGRWGGGEKIQERHQQRKTERKWEIGLGSIHRITSDLAVPFVAIWKQKLEQILLC